MFSAKKWRKTIEWERLETLQENERYQGTFHVKMVTIKDRNGLDLTEAEIVRSSCKNTWKKYTEKIFMTQIITMV